MSRSSKRRKKQADRRAVSRVAGRKQSAPPASLADPASYIVQPGSAGPTLGTITSITASRFQGPTPPPEVLRAYAELYPDAPRVIFESFEEQGRHRRKLENRQHWQTIARSWAGLVCGMIVTAGFLSLGGYAIHKGASLAAAAAFITAGAALVGVFVIGKYMTGKQLEQRNRAVPPNA